MAATGAERRVYTPEFKAAALQLHRGGQDLDEVSHALDVPVPLLRSWLLQSEVTYAGETRPGAPQPQPAAVRPAPAPVHATPAKHCMVCGRGPAFDVKLRSVTGIVIAFRMRSIKGTFCRDCGIAMTRHTLNRTLLTGWWGLFAGAANLYAAVVDAAALGRFRRGPAPVDDATAATLKPGRNLFQRAGVYVASFVTLVGVAVGLVAVGTAPDPAALNGKCVAFSQTKLVAKPCGGTHDGRVVGVVSNRAFCPEATDGTMRLKADDSKLLCVDLDQ